MPVVNNELLLGCGHRIASLAAQVHSRTIEIDLRHSERSHVDQQRIR